ncbi:DUF5813 family protein [Haloferax larsenii]|uniref:Uncharacterized protein n=1 Tax=Haloferax larsenii TaxID=302484 RepID=A0A1H7TID0_HALLR|nr:DUF5813 family protein [Haloferax larsenii]SEL84315.1 hypothetical protein SAMN04488691_10956 [Haloferax larsenii]
MSEQQELPGRVRRAFGDHGSFEHESERTFVSTTTHFDGRVTVTQRDDGKIEFEVSVRVPMLSAVTADGVADIVEDGWFETFELRMDDAGGVTAGDHQLEPTVERQDDEALVETSFADINERRGVDDAGAVIDYVEGTFVQGIIPGYDYTEPVTSILSRAQENAGTGF